MSIFFFVRRIEVLDLKELDDGELDCLTLFSVWLSMKLS